MNSQRNCNTLPQKSLYSESNLTLWWSCRVKPFPTTPPPHPQRLSLVCAGVLLTTWTPHHMHLTVIPYKIIISVFWAINTGGCRGACITVSRGRWMASCHDKSNSFAAVQSNHHPNTIMHSLGNSIQSSHFLLFDILRCFYRNDHRLAAAKPRQLAARAAAQTTRVHESYCGKEFFCPIMSSQSKNQTLHGFYAVIQKQRWSRRRIWQNMQGPMSLH